MPLKTLEVGLPVDRDDQLGGGRAGTAQIHPCLRRALESDSPENTASPTSILPRQTEMPRIERGLTPEKGIGVKFDEMEGWPSGGAFRWAAGLAFGANNVDLILAQHRQIQLSVSICIQNAKLQYGTRGSMPVGGHHYCSLGVGAVGRPLGARHQVPPLQAAARCQCAARYFGRGCLFSRIPDPRGNAGQPESGWKVDQRIGRQISAGALMWWQG